MTYFFTQSLSIPFVAWRTISFAQRLILASCLMVTCGIYSPETRADGFLPQFQFASDSARQETDAGAIILSDLRISLADAGAYFTAPLRFQAKDWVIAGGTLAASVGIMPFDERLNSVFLGNQSSSTDGVATVGRLYGETLVGGGIGAGLYVVGLATQNADVRITGRLALEALAFGGALNLTLKSLVGRTRPYVGQGAFVFNPVQFVDSTTSYPSGHATVAFAISSVLAERIGNPWIGAGLYALASLTALSRMYNTKHWASDIILGGAIGAGAGLLLTHLERERMKSMSLEQNILLYPTLTGLGLVVKL